MWQGQLGEIFEVSHRISLKYNARPTHANPYRAGQTGRKLVDYEVERIIKEDFIEPSQSYCASPVVLVSKPDVSVHFCAITDP